MFGEYLKHPHVLAHETSVTGANTHTALGRFGALEPLGPFESLSGFDFPAMSSDGTF
jgi:hypothetical protein